VAILHFSGKLRSIVFHHIPEYINPVVKQKSCIFWRDMKIHGLDIADALEREITANKMVPGVRLPSAAQLAKQYAVSQKTADRALSRLAKRKLIERRRGSGNFVMDNCSPENRIHAGVLWWTLNETMDELSFNPAEVFFSTLKKLMDERFINYSVFVEDSSHLQQPVNREKKYDIFLMPAGVILNDKEVYRSCRVPMIIYGDCKYNSGPWHQVIYDFAPGFTAALKYCRKIKKTKFFLPYKDVEIVRRKKDVLLACAMELGFREEDFHICLIPESISCNAAGGEYCAKYFLEHRLQDHLIFSVSDFFTYGMGKVFKKEGLKYPADFSMISYDNFYKYMDDSAEKELFNVPGITHPLEAHAAAVVDMISELNLHPDSGYYRAYITGAEELVIR